MKKVIVILNALSFLYFHNVTNIINKKNPDEYQLNLTQHLNTDLIISLQDLSRPTT